ncbi:MAG: hypothetical protein ACLFUS_08010 [Candidatus Sumerlaeia bacterium]
MEKKNPQMDEPENTSQPEEKPRAKKRKWRRRILWTLLSLVLLFLILLVSAWFYIQSSHFFNHFIAPQVSKTFDRDFEAEGYGFSPLGYLTLENIRLQKRADEKIATPLQAERMKISWDLFSTLSGSPTITGLQLTSASVHLYVDKTGKMYGPVPSISDRKTSPAAPTSTPPATPEGPADWTEFSVPRFSLRDIDLTSVSLSVTHETTSTEPRQFSFRIDSLQSKRFGLPEGGRLEMDGNFQLENMDRPSTHPLVSEVLQGKVNWLLEADPTSTTQNKTTSLTLHSRVQLSDLEGQYRDQDLQPYQFALSAKSQFDQGRLKISDLTITTIGSDNDIFQMTAELDHNLQDKAGRVKFDLKPVGSKFLNLAGAGTDINFQETTFGMGASMAWDAEGPTSLGLQMLLNDFSAKGGPIPKEEYPPLSLQADLGARRGESPKQFLVQRGGLDIYTGAADSKKQHVKFRVRETIPVNIRNFDIFSAIAEPRMLYLSIESVRTEAWEEWLPPSLLPWLADARVSGEIALGRDTKTSRALQLQADLQGQNINLTPGKTEGERLGGSNVDLATKISLRWEDKQLSGFQIDSGSVHARKDNETILQLGIDGESDLAFQKSSAKITIQNADAGRLLRAYNRTTRTLPLSGDLHSSITMQRDGKRFTAEGLVRLDPFYLFDYSGDSPSTISIPHELHFAQEINTEGPTWKLSTCSLTQYHPEGKNGILRASGNLDFTAPRQGRFQADATRINLTSLLPFVQIEPHEKAPHLIVEKADIDFIQDGPAIAFENFQMEVAEGNIALKSYRIRSYADAENYMKWEGLEAEGLDVDILMANLAADARGSVTGKMDLKSDGTSQGFDAASMRDNLRGDLEAHLYSGQLVDIPILNELGRVTGFDIFGKMFFESFDLRVKAEREGLRLEEAGIVGALQKLRFTGIIRYDSTIDIPITLGLGGSMRRKIGDLGFLKFMKLGSDNYLVFPFPLKATGTWSDPKIRMHVPVDYVTQTGKSIISIPGNIFNTAKDIISPDKSKEEPE